MLISNFSNLYNVEVIDCATQRALSSIHPLSLISDIKQAPPHLKECLFLFLSSKALTRALFANEPWAIVRQYKTKAIDYMGKMEHHNICFFSFVALDFETVGDLQFHPEGQRAQ